MASFPISGSSSAVESKEAELEQTIDICFLIEAEAFGSQDTHVLVQRLQNIVCTLDDATKYRVALVLHNSVGGGDDTQVLSFIPQAHAQRMESCVSTLQLGSHRSMETCNDGIEKVSSLPWEGRTRLLFHFCKDIQRHSSIAVIDLEKKLKAAFRDLQRFDVQYYICRVGSSGEMTSLLLRMARAVNCSCHLSHYSVPSEAANSVLDVVNSHVGVTRPRVKAQRPEFSIFAAIDFGTHGSGIAYADAENTEDVQICNLGRNHTVKTMTAVLLDRNEQVLDGPNGFGDEAYRYYYKELTDAHDDNESRRDFYFFEGFKMKLYEQSNNGEIAEFLEAANGTRVRTEAVLVGALKWMIRRAMDDIRSKDPRKQISDVQWSLTVPAIWSQNARRLMQICAIKAGIPKRHKSQIRIVLEPECASFVARDELKLPLASSYMLIDIGGGTVDIACHKLGESTVSEIHHASGGDMGSTKINTAFKHFLIALFAEVPQLPDQHQSAFQMVMETFESQKVGNSCEGREDVMRIAIRPLLPFLLSVYGSEAELKHHIESFVWNGKPGLVGYGTKNLKLTATLVRSFFDVILEPMIIHVRDLLGKVRQITKICLVGGLAKSRIVRQRFRDEFSGQFNLHDDCVVSPERPILAVVVGAVKFSFAPEAIENRKAQKNIGISCVSPWRPEDGDDRKIQSFNDDGSTWWGCAHTFSVLIWKGEDKTRVRYRDYRTYVPGSFLIRVYCLDDVPRYVNPKEYEYSFGTSWMTDKRSSVKIGYHGGGTVDYLSVEWGDSKTTNIELTPRRFSRLMH